MFTLRITTKHPKVQQLYNPASRAPRALLHHEHQGLGQCTHRFCPAAAVLCGSEGTSSKNTHCLLQKKNNQFKNPTRSCLGLAGEALPCSVQVPRGAELSSLFTLDSSGKPGLAQEHRDSLCPGSSPLPLTLLILQTFSQRIKGCDATAPGGGTSGVPNPCPAQGPAS